MHAQPSKKPMGAGPSVTAEDRAWAVAATEELCKTANVFYARVFVASDRLFVLIGEQHAPMKPQDMPLLRAIRELCGAVRVDIFLESAHLYRSEYRTRTLSNEQVDTKINEYLKQGADSLQVQRVVAELDCDTFRVHTVDVRDNGFMFFTFNIAPNLQPRAVEMVTDCYSITLQTNLDYVLKLARSSTRKGLNGSQDISNQNANALADEIRPLESTVDLDNVWGAYSKLVDIYMFPRMCREDNSKTCFFYGGQNHAQRTAACVAQLPGTELLFSFDRPDEDEDVAAEDAAAE